MKRNHAVIAVLTAFVLAVGVYCLGCTPVNSLTDEELITEDLSTQLDVLIRDNSTTQKAFMSGVGNALDEFGISSDAFAEALFDGFTYTIDDVDVVGDAASVDVTLHCKQVNPIIATFADTIEDDIWAAIAAEELDGQDEEALYAFAGQRLMQIVEEAEASDNQCYLTYSKSDDTWTIDSGSIDFLVRAILGEA